MAAARTKRTAARERLDRLIVERGLAPSRERAQAFVLAGRVQVDGVAVTKAGALVPRAAAIVVVGPDHPYVGRGGVKLAGALDALGIDPSGRVALDVGASTGGFTDCLLRRGARRVFALDVGAGQLDWSLRQDPRVVVMEHRNARALKPDDLPEPAEIVVVDVSFISLRLVLPPLRALLALEGTLLALVKPQFEVGRRDVGRGGIVREASLHRQAVATVVEAALACGYGLAGGCPSPLPGAEGNREFFVALHHGPEAGAPDVAAFVGGIVDEPQDPNR